MEIRTNQVTDEARLPTSGTCGNYMNVPEYKSDETLEKNLLIAVRNCGNIDPAFSICGTSLRNCGDIDPAFKHVYL